MWQSAIDIHFDEQSAHQPHAVLVFPFIQERLLWVLHPKRGWEVPGGKVEPGETPEQAARREVYEEAGATLGAVRWYSEYTIPSEQGNQFKWVYVAEVEDVHVRPVNSEILDVRVLSSEITPDTVGFRNDISPIMKDAVFQQLWPVIQKNWLRRQE